MAPITDKREILKREIASMLDHPSVFMGGPSQQNQRRADRIIQHLENQYGFSVAIRAANEQETPRIVQDAHSDTTGWFSR
jgi:hypothetical protein